MSTERGVLKGCNCCKSSNRFIRTMGARARIARCPRCKARTVFDPLTPEEAAAHKAKLDKAIALIESLMAEAEEIA